MTVATAKKAEKPKQPALVKKQPTTRQPAQTQTVKQQPVKPAAVAPVLTQQKSPLAAAQPRQTATANVMLMPVQKEANEATRDQVKMKSSSCYLP